MRIVYLIDSLGNSAGMERVLCTKSKYLAEQAGYEVHILTKHPIPSDLFYDFSQSVHIQSLSIPEKQGSRLYKLFNFFRRNLVYKKTLLNRLNKIEPDITISLFGSEFGFLPELNDGSVKIAEFHYSRNYLTHLIKHIPNLRFRWLRLIYGLLFQYKQRRNATSYRKVVLLTEYDRRLWGKKDNLSVIPNPLSFTLNKTATLTNKNILAVGRLIAQKGFDLLIEAFGMVADENPGWGVLIVGEGQDKEYLEKLIINKNLELKISIIKPEKNIQDMLVESSIFALPSRYEGFGLVLTEAMECGVPGVAFDCECGPSEILTNNIDGFLVENGNVIKFSKKLDVLMKDFELRKTMGAQAKQNVKRFYIEPVMQRWISLFNELRS